nr:hypothetical protein [Escherichia coli]
MKNQAHPIIVVKRRKAKSHGAAHGSWKIAYADFMTAMMAFFLVMWLISISSPKELIQIAEYFRTPLATAVTGGDRISNSESPIPGGGDDYTQSQGEVNKQPNIEELKKRMEQSRLRKLRGDLDQLIESDPKLRALRPHLKIDLVQEGLRIQIIDSQNRPMFRTGSADVEPYMRGVIVPIVDLRIKFSQVDVDYNDNTVVIVLNLGQRVVGIVVDGVSDVLSLTAEQIRPAPEFAVTLSTEYLTGLGALGDRMLILVNIEKLLNSEEMALLDSAASEVA